ncbi:MAG: MGMT family protein, partial [Methanobacterium sp.]|nr:MGMT family protein [Methanobacterium sp.]
GTAIGKNPFAIVVPCHRVVRSDGMIGGFRGGKEMKIEMLINEGFKIKSDKILLEK